MKSKFLYNLAAALFLIILIFLFKFQADKLWQDKVIFCNVGQGDAGIIVTKDKHAVLVDGGPDNSVLSCLGQALPFYTRTLDLVAITHNHEDHIYGLISVFKRYRVKKVLFSGALTDSDIFKELLGVIKKENAEVQIAQASETVSIGDLSLQVLAPKGSFYAKKVADPHTANVIIEGKLANDNFLILGDAPSEEQINIDDNRMPLVKIAHHGSKSGFNANFLKQIGVRKAIISVGKDNKYGLPNTDTLNALKSLGSQIFRTDEAGNIICLPKQLDWACGQ